MYDSNAEFIEKKGTIYNLKTLGKKFNKQRVHKPEQSAAKQTIQNRTVIVTELTIGTEIRVKQ